MILADTGPFVALLDPGDTRHNQVTQFFRTYRPLRDIVLTPLAIAEVAYLLQARRGTTAELTFLRRVADGVYPILDPILPDYARAADFVEEYADFPLGTVDALIAAMAERLKVTTILTLDRRHFEAIRPRHCERFELVP